MAAEEDIVPPWQAPDNAAASRQIRGSRTVNTMVQSIRPWGSA